MIWTQTKAIFFDAYRGLRARKMFWIVLGLSGLVVVLGAAVGVDKEGTYWFGWKLSPNGATDARPASMIYKDLFAGLGLQVWLSIIASILALISTAGIFPSLMTSGSIELMLSRPIGRVRLFLTQYVAGLLFVALQVFVFTLACFLVIGIRGDEWELGLFVAVPLVVCFFSYLFAISVFWGVLTRSTVAAILLTILLWFLFWGLHVAELGVLGAQIQHDRAVAFADVATFAAEDRIVELEDEIARLHAPASQPADGGGPSTGPTTGPDTRPARGRAGEIAQKRLDQDALREGIKELREVRSSWEETAREFGGIHKVLLRVKTFFPKTSETVELTRRILVNLADLPDLGPGEEVQQSQIPARDRVLRRAQRGMGEVLIERIYSRSAWWILGTSLAFEAVVLCLAGWIFCRRDY